MRCWSTWISLAVQPACYIHITIIVNPNIWKWLIDLTVSNALKHASSILLTLGANMRYILKLVRLNFSCCWAPYLTYTSPIVNCIRPCSSNSSAVNRLKIFDADCISIECSSAKTGWKYLHTDCISIECSSAKTGWKYLHTYCISIECSSAKTGWKYMT